MEGTHDCGLERIGDGLGSAGGGSQGIVSLCLNTTRTVQFSVFNWEIHST